MKTNKTIATAGFLLFGSLASGCGDDGEPEGVASWPRAHLIWKRDDALKRDLSEALALDPDEICTELGRHDCVETVHQTSLGGHNPFTQGLYRPVAEPLMTTPLVLDRVALSACSTRVEFDRAGPAEVFDALDLDAVVPPADSDAVQETIAVLYRRLLARDPLPQERDVIAELRVDPGGEPVDGAAFALAACTALATSTEFIFF